MTAQEAAIQEIQMQAAAQLGAAILISLSMIIVVLCVISFSFNLRKTGMTLFALYGFVIFWIPASITMYLGPLIFIMAIGRLAFGAFFKGGVRATA